MNSIPVWTAVDLGAFKADRLLSLAGNLRYSNPAAYDAIMREVQSRRVQ